MPDRIWNAAEYTRLSRDDGDKAESNSITSQKEIIRDYVRRHPEFVIVKEYADDGYSGVNFERPGFKQMMEDIKAKKIDCVICKDLSRFARNYIDAGRYLEKIFPFMGVRFIAINDNYDSCGEKAQSDALIVPFKNLINDAYCRDISVKIRSQLDIKRKMGDFIGAFAPYGYRKDEANRNRLVVDEEAARTVELIFRLRIQGLCNSAIADRLNSMGVLSPMEYKQAQGFNYSCGFRSNEQAEWSPMLVKRILSNEIYIGTLIQHKSGTPNHKIKKRVEYDRDEWIVIENNHEPIICRSDFDTVQNLMLRDVRTAPKQEKVHLFSGFVFCGDCKHTMVRKTVPSGGKKYHYLVCSTNKAGNKGTIQTAEMLMKVRNEEERAAIWIAATAKELSEYRGGRNLGYYPRTLHMAACKFLETRYSLWHHAMKRLVPEIMIPSPVLESIVCKGAEPVVGLIQMNTALLKSTWSILRYSSLKDGEIPKSSTV